jgi:hypothetical protein
LYKGDKPPLARLQFTTTVTITATAAKAAMGMMLVVEKEEQQQHYGAVAAPFFVSICHGNHVGTRKTLYYFVA